MLNYTEIMGNNFTYRQRFPILLAGLEGCGKTTIAFRMSLNKTVTTVPTVSFDRISAKSEHFKFDIQDLGGLTSLQHLWSLYYNNNTGIVFIVDSSRGDLAMKASARCLKDMLSHPDLEDCPLLVLANKTDLSWSKSMEHIERVLNLKQIRNRPVLIQSCCAVTGDGLYDSFRWLYEQIYIKFLEGDATWVQKRRSPRAMRRFSSIESMSKRESFRKQKDSLEKNNVVRVQ